MGGGASWWKAQLVSCWHAGLHKAQHFLSQKALVTDAGNQSGFALAQYNGIRRGCRTNVTMDEGQQSLRGEAQIRPDGLVLMVDSIRFEMEETKLADGLNLVQYQKE